MIPTSPSASHHASASHNSIIDGPLSDPPQGVSILPAEAYYDHTVFVEESRYIFQADWMWAGFSHWVPEPGSVYPVEIAGFPLLIVRGHDNEIRVFHNSCRHRGMTLVDEPTKVNKRIQCAYHCWAFNLDGSLALAPYFHRKQGNTVTPEMKAGLKLLSVPSYCWAGMIFINLHESHTEHADFPQFIAPLADRWSDIDFTRLSLAAERTYDLAVNWKLIIENFLDFYHLPFVHPQVGPVAASLHVDDVVLTDQIIGGCYPQGAERKAQKTEQSLPTFGNIAPERQGSQDIFCVFPNALLFIEADWFQIIGCNPLSPQRTLEHMAIFVDSSAAEEDHSVSRKKLSEVLFEVNEQDIPILQRLQQGKSSPAANYTNLIPSWDQITALFQTHIAQKLPRYQQDNSPADKKYD